MTDQTRFKNTIKVVYQETFSDDNLTIEQYLDLFCDKLAKAILDEVKQATVVGVQPGGGTATIQ